MASRGYFQKSCWLRIPRNVPERCIRPSLVLGWSFMVVRAHWRMFIRHVPTFRSSWGTRTCKPHIKCSDTRHAGRWPLRFSLLTRLKRVISYMHWFIVAYENDIQYVEIFDKPNCYSSVPVFCVRVREATFKRLAPHNILRKERSKVSCVTVYGYIEFVCVDGRRHR